MTFAVPNFQGLTFKIGNVKRMSPASKAGLSKMDYLISVILDIINGKLLNNLVYPKMIENNTKLSSDKWPASVQHDPRRDGKRDQKLRSHPAIGV